jgi:PAS domain S-box-containing protein
MPTRRKTSISSAFLRFTTLLSTLSILLLGAVWIGDDLYHFEEDSRLMRQESLEARKREIRQEVEIFLAKITDRRATLEESLRRDVRARTLEAWAVADNLHRLNAGRRSRDELTEMIREALRPIRYNNGRGYFFATGLDGTEHLFADRPELEGQNLLDMTDTAGKPVIRDMIRIAREQGEGYYEYHWTKPGTEGGGHRKLAYIKHFPAFDWFIGTGEYLEDAEADLRADVLRLIDGERFGQGGYLFAGTLDGDAIAGPARGRRMNQIADADERRIIREIIAAAQNGSGFVEYVRPQLPGNQPQRRLSYVTLVRDWNWLLGAGIDIGAIEEEIERRHADLLFNTRKHFAILAAVVVLVGLGQYMVARRGTARLRSGMSMFMDFFRRAGETGATLDPAAQPYAEMEELAFSANAMIESRMRAENALLASEGRYRRLVDNTLDAIFLADRDGRILDANAPACRRLGYSLEELTALHVWDVDADASPENFADFLNALDAGGAALIAGRHRKKDGTTFPVEIQTAAFLEGGKPLILGIARDITERYEAEERLRQSESKFVHIFQSSPDAMLLIDLGSERIREVNEACVRLFGHAREELQGRTTLEAGLYANEADRDRALRELRGGREVRNVEVGMRRNDGEALACLMSGVALDIEGEAHSLTVFHDITEQKKIREMMIHSEKMISVGGIAAGVAHEINNPLGIILQAAQNLMLRTRADFGKNQEVARELGFDLEGMERYVQARKLDVFIQDIRDAGIRAAAIVRNMLDFTRQGEARRTPCSMGDVAAKALNLARSDYDLKKSYDFRKIRVEIDEDSGVPPVLCSETEIEQVFLNLFRNAAQAMAGAAENADPRIRVRISTEGGWVRVQVEDNGPGIPPEARSRIFEPFYTTKKPGEGTGLGLSVSYFIVTRSHGGRISMSSPPGGGTRVTFELPVVPQTGIPETPPL